MTTESTGPRHDRRSFLRLGAGVGALGTLAIAAPTLLSACGSSAKSGTVGLSKTTTDQLTGLFNYTGSFLVTGIPQRLPFIISTSEGPPATTGPDLLQLQVYFGQEAVGGPIPVARHADGVPIGYYPLNYKFDRAGTWVVRTTIQGEETGMSFAVSAPDKVKLVQPGQKLPSALTPTVTDARNVNPICTASPQCPLHDRTVTAALDRGAPIALLVGTPAYCRTAVCGPVLDMLLSQREAFPTVQFLHAEVYNDPGAGSDPAAKGTTPVVDALGLTYEPSLFVVRNDGIVASRLDNIWDRVELATALKGVA